MELTLKDGFGGVAVGSAAPTPASRLSGAASERVARAPIRVFVCVAASKLEQDRPIANLKKSLIGKGRVAVAVGGVAGAGSSFF